MTTDEALRRRRELIALAEHIARAPLPQPRTPLVAAAGLVVVGVVSIGAGVKMASGSSSASGTTATQTVVSTVAPTVAPPTSFTPGTRITVPGQPTRWVVFADGRFHLRGAVPDPSAGSAFETAVGALLGTGRVDAEYDIDPAAPAPAAGQPDDTPVFVPNAASFTADSNALSAAAESELRLVWGLLGRSPDASVEVHTDPKSADRVLDASRADAVRRWFLGAGIPSSRVTVTDLPPYGEPVVTPQSDAIGLTVRGAIG